MAIIRLSIDFNIINEFNSINEFNIINEFNSPMKRQRMTEWIETKTQLYAAHKKLTSPIKIQMTEQKSDRKERDIPCKQKLVLILQDIGIGKGPKTQAEGAKIDKQNYIKIRSFCTVKETIH